MVEVWLPYGDTEVYISVDLKNLIAQLELEDKSPNKRAINIFSDALKEGGKAIKDLASPKCNTSIAVEGTTEPKIAITVLRELANRLDVLDVPKEKISVIIGNGTRQKSNKDLLNALREDEVLGSVILHEHGPDSSELTKLGSTSLGTPVNVDGRYVDADLKIAVGEVWPDAYTGFTGAHTAILPGISSIEAIESTRSHYFDEKDSRKKSNRLRVDALETAKIVGVDMAVNLLANTDGQLVNAYTGSVDQSWESVVKALDGWHQIDVEEKGDIVVASSGGKKRDFDLYHALWAIKTADKACKRNGTIILIAECREGLGVETLKSMASIRQLDEFERRYRLGAEAVQFVKSIARNKRLILVSVLPDYLIESLGFEASRDANSAYDMAFRGTRKKRTLAIPNGCFTEPA